MFGIATLLLALLLLTLRTDLFDAKFALAFSPPTAAPFFKGQPVKFQGFTIGRVQNVELLEQGKVWVTLHIFEKYHAMLHEGAKANLAKEGLIGEQIVEIGAGDKALPPIRSGSQLEYQSEASIEQLLQDVKPAIANANVLLAQLAELATDLNDPHGDLKGMLHQWNEASRGLSSEKIDASLTALAASLAELQQILTPLREQKAGEHLAGALAELDGLLHDTRPLGKELGKNGPQLVQGADALIRDLDRLSQSLKVVSDDLADTTPHLPGVAIDAQKTIREAQLLIRGLRSSWLLGGAPVAEDGGDGELVAPPQLEVRP